MHCARLGVGVAVVNRLLYAVGGFDGQHRLDSMECYHPENNEWTQVAPMTVARSGAGNLYCIFSLDCIYFMIEKFDKQIAGVAALNHWIYVVGGYDGTRQLDSVERFDTEKGVWETVSPIKVPRSALSLTVLDAKLYAMGITYIIINQYQNNCDYFIHFCRWVRRTSISFNCRSL